MSVCLSVSLSGKSDCPLFTTALASAGEEEKKTRRKQGYQKKKAKKQEEWTKHLREQTGLEGFAALYRVLGLPERNASGVTNNRTTSSPREYPESQSARCVDVWRKREYSRLSLSLERKRAAYIPITLSSISGRLSSTAEIKKAYHRRSLMFHPDKHPNNRDEAHERFLEIKAAYELLLEGMENGSVEGKAVFSAGELTDAAAAAALQEKVNALSKKVSESAAWAG